MNFKLYYRPAGYLPLSLAGLAAKEKSVIFVYKMDYSPDEYNNAFHKELKDYLHTYCRFLETKFTKSTVGKHWSIINEFNFWITGYKNVNGFEDLTIGLAGSKFAQHYGSNMGDGAISTFTSRNTIFGFFDFIYQKYNVSNREFLVKLKPKRVR